MGKKDKITKIFDKNINHSKNIRGGLFPNGKPFVWSLKSDIVDWKDNYWGFHNQALIKYGNKIKGALDNYITMTWNEVETRKSCHKMDLEKVEKCLQEELSKLYSEQSYVEDIFATLYQIQIDGKHRVWGYRGNDSVFYIVCNDTEHRGYKVKKKHT